MNEQRTSSLVGPLIIAAMLVVIPLLITSESNHLGYYSKLIWLHAGLVVLAAFVLRGQRRFARSPISLPLVVFLLANTISIIQSVNRVSTLVTLSHRLALLTTFVLFISTIDRKQIGRLVTTIGITSGVTSAIGIGQYAGWFGLDFPSSGMPSSTFGYRNFAAAFTIAAIPFVALEVVRRTRFEARLVWSFLLFLNATFLLATRSRSAWGSCALALLIVVIALAWRLRQPSSFPVPDLKQSSRFVAAATIFAVAFAMTVPHKIRGTGYDTHSGQAGQFVSVGLGEKASISGAITSTFEPGADKNRFRMWHHTLEMIQSFPIGGVGLGNWQYAYPYFDRGDVSGKGSTPRRPHNDYLWIASETGVIGFGIFLWLVVSIGLMAFRAVEKTDDETSLLFVAASIATLVAIGAHGVFSFPMERIPVTFLGAIALSILATFDPKLGFSHRAGNHRLALWVAIVAAQLLAGTIAWRAMRFDQLAHRQSTAIQLRDWVGAIQFGTRALTSGVFDPQALLLRGLSFHMAGQYDLAIADQKSCLRYHPYLVNAINNLGMSLNSAGRYDDAILALKRIETLNPDHVEVHLNAARSWEGKSDIPSAIQQLKLALEKEPNRTDIPLEIARLHEQSGEYDLAAKTIRNALRKSPNAFALYYRLGVVRQKQGNLSEAAAHFARVVELNTRYVPVYYNLGELSLAQGDTTTAIRSYETFISLWSGPGEAANAVRTRIEQLQ